MSKYEWSATSAFTKFFSDATITVNFPGGSFSKQTPACDRERHAYRNCAKCGRHYNYHKGGFCPG
uniref:Uncharacterized protein n=1 Tax=Moumouvirus sp. 'Monve' TaxID=1128131 RepID=H2EFI3_9VIRU|nr:hypothetical protein mv_R1046 [Moumouvirus Monve]